MDSDIFLVRLEVVEYQSLSPVLFDGNGYEALTGVVKVVGPRLCIFTRVRNRGVKVREFAIIFPLTLSCSGRAQ